MLIGPGRSRSSPFLRYFPTTASCNGWCSKGGNAIDIALDAGTRASADIDLSMPDEFTLEELDGVKSRIGSCLERTFREHGFKVFGFKMDEVPSDISPEIRAFWGGYRAEFKIIDSAMYGEFCDRPNDLHRQAVKIGRGGKLTIDISRFEFCRDKDSRNIDGLTIYVYSPIMIVCEKIASVMPADARIRGNCTPPAPRRFTGA